MIRTASEMLAALRSRRFVGIVLYEGASLLDGRPVVAIATGIAGGSSSNVKTGAMVQTWILRSDVDPVTALRIGADASVCGDCKHKPSEQGTCYVLVWQAPASVWESYHRDRYARPGIDYDPAILPALFAGTDFRAGSYGDPTAIPYRIWREATRKVRSLTGYSHQWRQRRFRHFARLCMASVDSLAEMGDARAAGWRTFRVRAAVEAKQPGEVICPASAEAGHRTTCASCRACGGLSAKAKASIVIMAHGATAKRHNQELAA